MTDLRPLSRCDRVGLLLSLDDDGRATPDQRAEIDEHLPDCRACRAALRSDYAVSTRLRTPAVVPGGFADRVAAAAMRQDREGRAQNRLLLLGAAAAVVVAALTATWTRGGGTQSPAPDRGAVVAGAAATLGAAPSRAAVRGTLIGRTAGSHSLDRSSEEDR